MQVNKISLQIVERTKEKNLGLIFDKLDSDGDGLISTHNINLEQIDSKLKDMLKPLLDELEQIQDSLDREEF